MKFYFFLSCLVVLCPKINANDNLVELNKIITTFKSMSYAGYHINYYGTGEVKNATKFEGDVRIKWSEQADFDYENIRIQGSYHVKDILGKRNESANIYLNGDVFWNVDHTSKVYTYSPDIRSTLRTAFRKSPIFPFTALTFMKKNPSSVKISTDANTIQLTCSTNGKSFRIIANKSDHSIRKITWKKDNWKKNSEITAELHFKHLEAIKDFGKPNVKDYDKKMLPTKGYEAPKWQSVYHSGGPVNLDQFKGEIVVMDFWATWCSPCIRAIPSLQKLHATYGEKGVNILGLNYFEKRNPKKIMKKLKATYPTIQAESIGKDYGILNWPTTFVVDKKGVIREIIVGYHGEKTDKQLNELIQKLITE
ncbi:TlpA disulfide reductase family protein [Winogradskyella sp.]|uniref:TlpA family protein disulfide reductase n=1 Tax=Winogradskyella sp. TaxID=1883156 RepID=UPI00263443D2|nr:TlpA disulfide reductase family protein [Winogradskyella sp.]